MNDYEHSSARDLPESLGTRLLALQQHFPDIDAKVIEAVAELDPTRSKKYVTWLLTRYKNEPENIPIGDDPDQQAEAQKLRELISVFDTQKAKSTWTGSRDINYYRTLTSFAEAVDANRPVPGMEVIAKHGAMLLYRVTTGEAARKLAIGPGGRTNSPQSTWCTIAVQTAENYIDDSPLYVVYKNNAPYVQAHFGASYENSSAQVRNTANLEIKEPVAREIAPLFTSPIFERYWRWRKLTYRPTTSDRWILNPEKVAHQLELAHRKFRAERWAGWQETCRHCQGDGCDRCGNTGTKEYGPYVNLQCPECHGQRNEAQDGGACLTCMDVIEQRWLKVRPRFVELLENAVVNNDRDLLPLVADFFKGTSMKGIQLLYNAVYELLNRETSNV